MKILIIDDDSGLRKSLTLILKDAGYEVVQAEDGISGLSAAAEHEPSLILCDVRMPRLDGLGFLERYHEQGGGALVLVMTAYGSLDMAVEAMKRGAYDYLPKPFGADEVLLTVRKAEERENLRREVGRLRREVQVDRRFSEIVAGSGAGRNLHGQGPGHVPVPALRQGVEHQRASKGEGRHIHHERDEPRKETAPQDNPHRPFRWKTMT